MTEVTSLVTLINQLTGGRVLCVGDVMLDRFTYGEVTRISAEAPIPVCRVVNETIMLGGAGNVVRNLDALGVDTDFVTVVGADEAGRQVDDFLQTLSAVDACLLTDPSRQTTIKDRFIAGVQQLLRVDRESIAPVDGAIAAEVHARAEASLAAVGAVVVSDYGKGVLAGDAIETLPRQAREAGKPLIVDPKGADSQPTRTG
jgi:D-beta-D-heptose 7-phosphate kinase/D-beta-D-heptose 1-phosphate adenosyltransferase